MPRSVFKQQPTTEVINQTLQSVGIDDLDSSREICALHFNKVLAQNAREALRPFYYPCIAKGILSREEVTFRDQLQIIRQLLRTRRRVLKRREKCVKVGEKTYEYVPYYSLIPGAERTNPDILVTLN